MKAFKTKHGMILGVLAIIALIVWYYTKNQNSTESSYVTKCPCPGVQVSGQPGAVYYNSSCCAKATASMGSVSKGGSGRA